MWESGESWKPKLKLTLPTLKLFSYTELEIHKEIARIDLDLAKVNFKWSSQKQLF